MKNIYIMTLATVLLIANSAHVLAAEKSKSQTEQYITNFVNRYSGCRGDFGGSASIEVKSPNIIYTETAKTETDAFTYVSRVSINDIGTAQASKDEGRGCNTFLVLTCVAATNCVSVADDTGGRRQRHTIHIGLNASPEDAEKLQRAFEHLSKLNFDVDDF